MGSLRKRKKAETSTTELNISLSKKNFYGKKTRNNSNRDEIAEKAAREFLVHCWSSGPVIDREFLETETTKNQNYKSDMSHNTQSPQFH